MPEEGGKLEGSLQDNALTLMCFSDKYCNLARNVLSPSLFSTYLYRDVAARARAYIDQFKRPPKEHLPDLCEDLIESKDADRAENVKTLLRRIKTLAPHLNGEYVVSQLETFVRQQSIRFGVIEAAEAIERQDTDAAERALQQAMQSRISVFDSGVGLDEVYRNIGKHEQERERVILGIPELDKYGYGPTRKELFLLQAPVKRGKTWGLIHCATRAMMQKWRVLCITLEVGADIYGRRILQSMFGIAKRQADEIDLPVMVEDENGRLVDLYLDQKPKWPALDNPADVKSIGKRLVRLRQRHNLLIKEFPTRRLTVNGLIAFLDNLDASEHFTPDLCIVDYPDLMFLDSKDRRVAIGDTVADLRGLAVERNMAVAIASQVNREGASVKTSSEVHAAEDFSKFMTADQAISYNQTESEKELHLARLFVAAGRNDRSRYTVLISQAYEIGQFVVDSRALTREYWTVLEEAGRKNAYRKQSATRNRPKEAEGKG